MEKENINKIVERAFNSKEPEVEIELDDYRSYNRSKRSGLTTSK